MTAPLAQTTTVVVPQMEGVTTALVAFIFVCVIYPRLVKNKPQFYGALAAVVLIILLYSLSVMLRDSAGFQVFSGAATGLLQAGAILLLFLSAGGITLKELSGDMARAYEVIRRGEEQKTVIVPLSGEQPKPRQPAETIPPQRTPEATPPGEKIDLPPEAGWPTKPSPSPPPAEGKPADTSSLPLE